MTHALFGGYFQEDVTAHVIAQEKKASTDGGAPNATPSAFRVSRTRATSRRNIYFVDEFGLEIRPRRDAHRTFATPQRLDFGYHDASADLLNCVPDPVIDPVDIQRQQIDLALHTVRGDEVVHVIGRTPRVHEVGRIQDGVGMVPEAVPADFHMRLVAIEGRAGPAMIDHQVRAVTLAAVAATDFHALSVDTTPQ